MPGSLLPNGAKGKRNLREMRERALQERERERERRGEGTTERWPEAPQPDARIKKGVQGQGICKGLINVIDKSGTSLFFTNFPEDWTTRSMWIHFQRFGQVIDIFIPEKRSRLGMKFDFVKYKYINEIKQLVSRIKAFVVGAEYLVINEARFRRGEGRQKSQDARRSIEEDPLGRPPRVGRSSTIWLLGRTRP